jgi:anti-sigma regulatory factor (Ser/Thr protein kinase)
VQLEEATWQADPTTPRKARGLVEAFLGRNDHDPLIPAATLLTSELVTNAVLHAGGTIGLRASWENDRLRVEITDGSTTTPEADRVVSEAASGRGLQLVGALSTRWGSSPTATGKVVWFELMP